MAKPDKYGVDSIETHDAEIHTINGATPLNTEVRLARQVVVVQEEVLVIKLKKGDAYRIIGGMLGKESKESFDILMTTIEDFCHAETPRDIMEPKTIFDE